MEIDYNNTKYSGWKPSVTRTLTCLAYMFYEYEIEAGEVCVTSEEILAWIEKYERDDFLFADEVDAGRKKGQQTVNIGIGKTFDFENFAGVRDCRGRYSKHRS